MLKLIKYELRKTLPVKLICMGLGLLVELFFLYGVFAKNNTAIFTAACLLGVGAIACELIVGLSTNVTMHRDLNTRQSYMLFMTPNSTFKILGAKVIENALSIMIVGAILFGLGMLDIALLKDRFDILKEIYRLFESYLRQFNITLKVDGAFIGALLFNIEANWIGIVTAGLLADVICAALLNGKKASGLLTFVIVVLLLVLESRIQGFVNNDAIPLTVQGHAIDGCINLAWALLMYVAAAVIMDRKLSV